MGPNNASISEVNVETAVALERVVDYLLHRLLVGRVELARVDIDFGPQRVDLALVRLEVAVIVVAQVDGFGAVLGKLMS